MKANDIKCVLAVGAGTMGHQIGFLCAAHGYEAIIYDVKAEALDFARERVVRLADEFVKRGRLAAEDKPVVLERITYTDRAGDAAARADIVTESVPEDPALKGRVFAELHGLCPERTIFTTNTSTLVPSMFAEASGRPDRLLALHFHDVLFTDVVDVMPHPGTSPEAVAVVKAFAESLDQMVIVLEKENFGYVFNAMLSDLFRSALTLTANGVASAQDVDRAWMGVLKAPVGPFGLMDSVGLDTVWKITDYWAGVTKDPQLQANAAFLKKYIDEGCLGGKCGRGFYSYPEPLYQQPDFLKGK